MFRDFVGLLMLIIFFHLLYKFGLWLETPFKWEEEEIVEEEPLPKPKKPKKKKEVLIIRSMSGTQKIRK